MGAWFFHLREKFTFDLMCMLESINFFGGGEGTTREQLAVNPLVLG
jgi:hypothetical protein